MDILEHLLQADVARAHEPIASLAAWFEALDATPAMATIDRALWAGFASDRLGYAFVGGYQAALRRLLSSVAPPGRRSLAATESGGAHPRAIETRLEHTHSGGVLNGEKTFVTLASAAEELLVVATSGVEDGKNRLRVVRVRVDAPGLTIEDRPPMPFAPELPHAKVKLVDVTVGRGDILPGDGYDVYLKPFRTIEDVHVLAASLGLLVRMARAHRFAGAVTEGAIAVILALRSVAALDPADPKGHLALSGLFQATRRLITEHDAEWEKADAEIRDRWRRDLGLLIVAENARQKRTEAAWRVLEAGYSASP